MTQSTSIIAELLGPRANRRVQRRNGDARPLRQFLAEEIHTDNGPWSIDKHEALAEPIALLERSVLQRETGTRVSLQKGEQLTVSTLALGVSGWVSAELGYNSGYFLPDDDFASEFGLTRLNPIVDQSPLMSSSAEVGNVSRGTLKEFGNRKFLYILGLKVLTGATTRPMDFQNFDEVDLIGETAMNWCDGRLMHSKLGVQWFFSAPYAQESGIAARFDAGSQRRYLVKCESCGESDICLEEAFPECMREFNGTWVRVCPKCHLKLDIVTNGQWVPTFVEREKDRNYSFRLSALSVNAISANVIMARYRKAQDNSELLTIFNRSVRALPDAGTMQPFSETELNRMAAPPLGDYVLSPQRTGNPVYLGGDVGNACWFAAIEWLPAGRPRLIWAEKTHSDRWVARAIELLRRLRPRFAVFDMMPLFNESRKIAYAFPSIVGLAQFESGKELYVRSDRVTVDETLGAATNTVVGPEYLSVRVDRDILLGNFAARATHAEKGLVIPREQSVTMGFVRQHLKKLQRQTKHDARGNVMNRFVDKVENHLGLALAYAYAAHDVAPQTSGLVGFFPAQTARDESSIPSASGEWGGLVGGD